MSESFYYLIIGWIGMTLLLLGYFLLTFKKVKPDSLAYSSINALGALAILVNAFYYESFPIMILNLFWIVIASVSIIKGLLNKNKK